MASRKQIAANTANAKRSTGPNSAAGKTRSSINARKHGLTAKSIVIGDEDPANFDRLRAECEEDYKPQTAVECELVERLAGLFWRLRRIPIFEAALLTAPSDEVPGPEWERREKLRIEKMEEISSWYLPKEKIPDQPQIPTPEKPERGNESDLNQEGAEHQQRSTDIGLTLIRDSQKHDVLSKLSRYETGLMNAVTRTLNLLHVLQTARKAAEENRLTIQSSL